MLIKLNKKDGGGGWALPSLTLRTSCLCVCVGGGGQLVEALTHSQTVFLKHFQTKEKQKWQPYFYKAGRHILQSPPTPKKKTSRSLRRDGGFKISGDGGEGGERRTQRCLFIMSEATIVYGSFD